MSLPHILLGLMRSPVSGYDIRKTFESTLSFFWSANLAQIYPALKKLEADGLTRSWTEPSSKGPERRVYQQTDEGRRELARWLGAGPLVTAERRHYLAQVFFLGQVEDLVDARAFFETLRDEMMLRRDRLRALEEAEREASDLALSEADDEAFFEHLVFQLGQDMFETYVRWAEGAVERLEARAGGEPQD